MSKEQVESTSTKNVKKSGREIREEYKAKALEIANSTFNLSTEKGKVDALTALNQVGYKFENDSVLNILSANNVNAKSKIEYNFKELILALIAKGGKFTETTEKFLDNVDNIDNYTDLVYVKLMDLISSNNGVLKPQVIADIAGLIYRESDQHSHNHNPSYARHHIIDLVMENLP